MQNYLAETKVWNKLPFWFLIREFWYIFIFFQTLSPLFDQFFFLFFLLIWRHCFIIPEVLSFYPEISWFQEISWKVASLKFKAQRNIFWIENVTKILPFMKRHIARAHTHTHTHIHIHKCTHSFVWLLILLYLKTAFVDVFFLSLRQLRTVAMPCGVFVRNLFVLCPQPCKPPASLHTHICTHALHTQTWTNTHTYMHTNTDMHTHTHTHWRRGRHAHIKHITHISIAIAITANMNTINKLQTVFRTLWNVALPPLAHFTHPFCKFISTHNRISRQLRARRALKIYKDVLLRTRRALLLYKVYGDRALLVINGTSLNRH